MLRFLWQPLYFAFAISTFSASVLLAFPFVLLISAGKSKRSRRLIWTIAHWWGKLWLWLIGMPLKITGNYPDKGRYVIVANHISYLDAIAIFPAIPTYFRPLAKKEFARTPLLGYIYKHLALLVDRSSHHSRSKSMRLMYRTLRHEASILIFPEGTFNETGAPLKAFYDGAFRLALNTQVPVLPVLFPDTQDRWHYSGWWKVTPGRNRAVYLDPIPVAGMTLEDLPLLKQRVYEVMEAALIRLREEH
jgi:1-acyl-sn-glycerol-3-phosphate acyltransferase